MANNELEKKKQTLPSQSEWEILKEQANIMIRSRFLPPAIQTPEQAIAIALTGKELGLSPMQSFRSINVIQGKPTLSANLMLALAAKTGQLEDQGYEAIPDKRNCQKVVYTVKRKDMSPIVEEFGVEEARGLGLLGKDNYKKQAFTMFKWRAISAGLRVAFADVLHGIYTPEELGAEVEVKDGEDVVPVRGTAPPVEQSESPPSVPDKIPGQDVPPVPPLTEQTEAVTPSDAQPRDNVPRADIQAKEISPGLFSASFVPSEVRQKFSNVNKRTFYMVMNDEDAYFVFSDTQAAKAIQAKKDDTLVMIHFEMAKGKRKVKNVLTEDEAGTAQEEPSEDN